ncbi:uncharacterized protein LOC111370097 [Olea europaea var. sylvestris]|uniref:uncharacterized protein LOC111370097 n=1 Tax=Olea europaea var. sylvestris TaxID=158386 RepID=UPI000C1D4BC2|nr:uncharacterized protein LOC111370097 [Olea europaea var. sylvestris]
MNIDNVDKEVSNNVEFDVTKPPTDPGLRIPIFDYNANIRDDVRRAYMLKGPCSTYWKDKKRLHTHVGLHDSAHNQAHIKCEVLMNQEQHIQSVFYKQSEQARSAYVTRLTASIDCVRLLLRQGHSFRGHNESEDSLNPVINAITLGNAPHNCKLTSTDVQKDIVNACAIETINVIIKDVGDSLFSILVDESRDVSMKEQISIVLHYVDNSRHVNECFIGIEHVTSTTNLSLKAAIDKVFSRYNLSMSRLRGQGYDGASNMQGKFNGLKILILKESSCAFYIHYFTHQLQLTLVAVAKKNIPITNFFRVVGDVIYTIGASSKCSDLLREKQLDFIIEALEKGEILSRPGLNQETTLQCSSDTQWSSHYNSLVSLLFMFSSVLNVLAMIVENESRSCDQRSYATNLLESIQKFDFAFNLQLMRSVLGMSNELSKALQKKKIKILLIQCNWCKMDTIDVDISEGKDTSQLETTLKFEKDFERFENEDTQYLHYFREDDGGRRRSAPSSKLHWENGSVEIETLSKFCDEQNISQRNVREKRDENDVGNVNVGDVGGIGGVGDVDVA